LGSQYAGDLFVGGARTFLDGGYLLDFKFDQGRQHFAFSDPKLADKVDDNDYKFDEGESGSLVAGKNFVIVTDIEAGPDGKLYVTSLSNGAVYRISQKPQTPVPPPPGPQNVTGTTIVVSAGRSFRAEVATFTDADSGVTAGSIKAVILWGDQSRPTRARVREQDQ